MSDWRDPDPKDYRLPSRKELENSNNSLENPDNLKSFKPLFLVLRTSILTLIIVMFIAIAAYFSNLFFREEKSDNPILTALEYYLKAGNFKTADILTRVYFYDNIESTERYISEQDLEDFDCNKLIYIDGLWKKYSNNKFGLSGQVKLWRDAKKNVGSSKPNEINVEFGNKVGWYNKRTKKWLPVDDLDYSLKAPVGHLPTRSPVFGTVNIGGEEYPNEMDKGWLFNSFLRSSISDKCFN